MTKEQRTSLNILIDLAIRKGIDFELSNRRNSILFKHPDKYWVYWFKGEYSRDGDFKQAQQILNKY